MPASLSEQARAHFRLALLAAPQIVGVEDRVHRAREDLFSESEIADGAINILAGDEFARKLGAGANDNELVVEVEYYVRAAQDEVWETKADALAVAGHAKLMGYPSWPAWIAEVRHIGVDRGAERGNRTPGKETHRYAVRFLSSAKALDQTP